MPAGPPISALPERPDSLARQVHDILSEMLLSGQLRPADRMSMRDLADQLGVSVMPVRDAVSRLVAAGALESRPNRAVAVPLMTRAGFRDLTEIRIHNEMLAVRLATLRMSVPQLDQLRQLEIAFCMSLEGPDSRDAVRANKTLHFHIYESAGSPVLRDVIAGMWLKAGPVITLDLGEASRRSRNAASVSNHADLVRAIVAREPDAAAHALEADIRSAAEFILSRDVLRD
ncbi:GntR family transcriptional regulator [Paracoccus sp. CPCC 101403]|uniref:GntR family transcriptional regulator n=1 Tax=Paracoccus broussonetiae TaxID=3075834 RepID=A0ABU3EIU6_9RHOB|nr:GntR family transcriptional regulator [Paracoccus sp. CPCC 101403]MDT1064171.1 GntR family transcriptional regulator [Paracoccus sp. CPCC 101403]